MSKILNRLNVFEARRKKEIILVGFLLWLLLINLVLAGWNSEVKNVPNHPPLVLTPVLEKGVKIYL